MYSASQIRYGLENPQVGLRELNRRFWDRAGRRAYNPDGTDIFEEDWDNLLILDGCRYDYFAEAVSEYEIDGELESRTSRGSATKEFLRGNFHGRDLRDTVYVTASTMLYQENVFRDGVDVNLHATVDVWEEGIDFGEDGVHPSTVADAAREAAEKYPKKRLVVHFVQPHAPYIGTRGRELFPDLAPNPLSEQFRGVRDVPDEYFETVYRENLELALDEVVPLLRDLRGRSVVTADHGMLLGERERPIPIRSYGHPSRLYVEEMVEVPWFVHDTGDRKDIVAGDAQGGYERKRDDELDERAREHLRSMGYL
ncbi:hypothetical protein [Halopelagius fulvigenes]|uniref:Sulfatase n=1 Tax=Halopelagius fulvigenes TaxID=1198324 RepID=A0ABD5TZD7_9EURY